MNWRHLWAFIWLRWRLTANQWRRAGKLSAALMIIITVSAIIAAIPLFLGSFALGVYLIPKAKPAYLMYAWDGLIVAYLFFWMIGLITELQRNDPLALSKFLHLPVSVRSAFLINYLSSLARLSLVFFVPVMSAYALALVYVQGVAQLSVLPCLAAFFLMITAPTYQFQGWLGSLIGNPRRRRTVVVTATMAFVLVFQLPNLLNLYGPRLSAKQAARSSQQVADLAGLQKSLQSKEIGNQEFVSRSKEITERYAAESKRASAEEKAFWERTFRIANMALPIGWLPMGVMSGAEGRAWPSLLGFAGMTLIGLASLWRAYRTTLGQYQGASTNVTGRAPSTRPVEPVKPGGRTMMEARLPGFSEPVSAIALGGFRSLVRAPEAKLALLMPLIMGLIFGSVLLQGRSSFPAALRPLFGIGAIGFALFGLLQVMSNQFGTDRDAFRLFVLCAVPRREILLGKNLSYLPAAVLISAILLTIVQVISPMRIDHALAMVPQFVSMYLLFCSVANFSSIYVPVYITPGTLKPANPKLTTILLQLLLFLLLFPLVQILTMIPIGAEALLNYRGLAQGIPVCLLLSVAEAVGVVFLYRASLGWLGGELQAREQKILETVTNRAL